MSSVIIIFSIYCLFITNLGTSINVLPVYTGRYKTCCLRWARRVYRHRVREAGHDFQAYSSAARGILTATRQIDIRHHYADFSGAIRFRRRQHAIYFIAATLQNSRFIKSQDDNIEGYILGPQYIGRAPAMGIHIEAGSSSDTMGLWARWYACAAVLRFQWVSEFRGSCASHRASRQQAPKVYWVRTKWCAPNEVYSILAEPPLSANVPSEGLRALNKEYTTMVFIWYVDWLFISNWGKIGGYRPFPVSSNDAGRSFSFAHDL